MRSFQQALNAIGYAVPFICNTVVKAERATSGNSSVASMFHTRAFQSSIVLGDYLYLDGGELTTWNGRGTGYSYTTAGNLTTLPDNHTYSIDLTSSWTNATVRLHQIEKAAPVLVSEALWADDSGKGFYAYDGGVSWSLPANELPGPPGNSLWQFTPAGNSGSWSEVPISPASNFSTLQRAVHASYASGGGLAFALGGVEDMATTTVYTDQDEVYDVPGMVIYNTTSQEWYNVSTTTGWNLEGTVSNGAAHFAPSLGPAGLLFAFGGMDTWWSEDGSYFDFNNVTMYEPASQQWQSQTTTGDAPLPLMNPCVVGLEGDNNTYEIFLYGGYSRGFTEDNVRTTIAMGAVHVLSLPSFHWVKQSHTPDFGRYMHSCNIVGRSQMVSVGGLVVTEESVNYGEASGPDPWPQGFGIFDLSAMEWSASYNSSAASYITPQLIKSYVQEKGRLPPSWANPTVESWFTDKGVTSSHAPSSSGGPKANKASSSNTAAIAGGVVGGLVALMLIVAAIWFLRRRRGGTKADQENRESSIEKSGLDGELPGENAIWEVGSDEPFELKNELRGSKGGIELPAKEIPTEAASTPVHELDTPVHEMGA